CGAVGTFIEGERDGWRWTLFPDFRQASNPKISSSTSCTSSASPGPRSSAHLEPARATGPPPCGSVRSLLTKPSNDAAESLRPDGKRPNPHHPPVQSSERPCLDPVPSACSRPAFQLSDSAARSQPQVTPASLIAPSGCAPAGPSSVANRTETRFRSTPPRQQTTDPAHRRPSRG